MYVKRIIYRALVHLSLAYNKLATNIFYVIPNLNGMKFYHHGTFYVCVCVLVCVCEVPNNLKVFDIRTVSIKGE